MGASPGKPETPPVGGGGAFQTCVVFDYISNPVEYLEGDSLYDEGKNKSILFARGITET